MRQEDILRILPHRAPMLLVDEVLEADPGRRAVGLKHVTEGDFWVTGHYPGNPIMPGVLQIEAMAQTAGVAMLMQADLQNKVPVFAGIDRVRFRRPVRPGDTLRIEVEIIKMRGPISRATGRAYVGNDLACEAELMFALADAEQLKGNR